MRALWLRRKARSILYPHCAVPFALLHVYQGLAGVVSTGLIGLVFCVCFVLVKRNLWVVIIAHGLIHLMSFTAIYFGLA